MAVTIQIEDRTAQALQAQAEALGLTIDDFLRRIAEGTHGPVAPSNGSPAEAAADFDSALDELFAGDSRQLPAIAITYSRKDIYFDHD